MGCLYAQLCQWKPWAYTDTHTVVVVMLSTHIVGAMLDFCQELLSCPYQPPAMVLGFLQEVPNAEEVKLAGIRTARDRTPCEAVKFPLVLREAATPVLSCSHPGIGVLRGHHWAAELGWKMDPKP